MYSFKEFLEYNNLSDIPYSEIAEETYEMDIPYNNTIKLSFISSFIGDLTNNGYDVNSKMEDGVAHIKAFKNAMESQYASKNLDSRLKISTAAAYYMIKRWVDKLNRQLQDVEVAVEKMTTGIDYTGRNQGTKKFERGRYGNESMFYIINPENNIDEVDMIIDFLSLYDVPLRAEDFKHVYPVSDSPFLQSLGHSDNETYISFIIPKDTINFDYTKNLEGYRKSIQKQKK